MAWGKTGHFLPRRKGNTINCEERRGFFPFSLCLTWQEILQNTSGQKRKIIWRRRSFYGVTLSVLGEERKRRRINFLDNILRERRRRRSTSIYYWWQQKMICAPLLMRLRKTRMAELVRPFFSPRTCPRSCHFWPLFQSPLHFSDPLLCINNLSLSLPLSVSFFFWKTENNIQQQEKIVVEKMFLPCEKNCSFLRLLC